MSYVSKNRRMAFSQKQGRINPKSIYGRGRDRECGVTPRKMGPCTEGRHLSKRTAKSLVSSCNLLNFTPPISTAKKATPA